MWSRDHSDAIFLVHDLSMQRELGYGLPRFATGRHEAGCPEYLFALSRRFGPLTADCQVS
jgi:hypothetical protein